MVREFTELQGKMGGIYARDAGEPETIWRAIYHHYSPIAADANAAPLAEHLGGAAVTWAAVSLADKFDTVVGLFAAGERPTGSRDPFGLRRQAHGILRILLDADTLTATEARPSFGTFLAAVEPKFAQAGSELGADVEGARPALHAFIGERLEYVLEQRGAKRQAVRAVVRGRQVPDLRPLDVKRNVAALQEFVDSESFRKLAEAFKRVRNIARELDDATAVADDAWRGELKDAAEIALFDEIQRRGGVIERAVAEGRDFRAAYVEAAQFQPAVDKFFTEVFVMVEDAALRRARLRLMKRLEQLILQLGDISEIVAPES